MSIGNDENDVVVHGDLNSLAYMNKDDLRLPTITFVGQRYLRTPINAISSNAAFSITTNYYTPIYIDSFVTLDALCVKTGTGHTGTSSARLGLFAHDYQTGKPSALIKDAGTVSMSASAGTYTASFTAIGLQPGIYWVACNVISITGTFTAVGVAGGNAVTNELLGAISVTAFGSFILGFNESYNATSAFAATAGTLTSSTALPYVYARIQ